MTESNELLLQCYNKGCSQLYRESENNDDACLFHPGGPIFHDAYKGWSCCKKKCTDFTEFLNIKGCTKARHSNVKPTEPEKPKVTTSNKEEVITYTPPTPKAMARPDSSLPMVLLPVTIAPSLKQLLEKRKDESQSPTSDPAKPLAIEVGTCCKNSGCQKSYQGEHSNSETCVYHQGVPIFHEGMKYWSCCKKKTTEFDNFLNQEGCTTGKHVWIKKEETGLTVACRYDWHQTGPFVFISIYAKGCNPECSSVEANPVKIKVHLEFGGGAYDQEWTLRGVVDIEKSVVTMSGTKVEVKLKKADVMSWDKLELPQQMVKQAEAEEDNLDNIELRNIKLGN